MEKSCGTMTYMSLTRVSKSNCPKPLFQSEAKCEAINKPANKTHFHMRDFALSFFLKVRVFRTRNWPIENTQFTFSSTTTYQALDYLVLPRATPDVGSLLCRWTCHSRRLDVVSG